MKEQQKLKCCKDLITGKETFLWKQIEKRLTEKYDLYAKTIQDVE